MPNQMPDTVVTGQAHADRALLELYLNCLSDERLLVLDEQNQAAQLATDQPNPAGRSDDQAA